MKRSQLYRKGIELSGAGHYRQAFSCMKNYLAEEPNDAEAWNDAGAILFSLCRYQESIAYFERAGALKFDHGELYSNLARAYLADGKSGMVVEMFEVLHEKGVLSDEIVRGTVESFVRFGDKVNAMEAAVRAQEFCPKSKKLKTLIKKMKSKRAKIAFFCGADGPTFLEDILEFADKRFEIRFFDGETFEQMYELMKWSDISWFEWCTNLAVKASNWPKVCKNIIRLHRYEAYIECPRQINWCNIDHLITVGNECVNEMLEKQVPGIGELTHIVEIPNGIDISKYDIENKPKGKNLAFVGKLKMVKNPMLLLQCMHQLCSIDPEYKLYIAGYVSDEEAFVGQYFEHMIKEFGLEGSVFIDGWQSDMNSWFADKDYIVCTSVIESQGMGVLEGMACGLKPVVHNFPGAAKTFSRKYLFNTADDFCIHVLSDNHNPIDYQDFVEYKYSLKLQLMRVNGLLMSVERTVPDIGVGSDVLPAFSGGVFNETELLNC
ncbi:MAG: glycosyltransferase [Planctomycetes bacterium]|nr:glycosyltransferase [Planctomycetota bacterium]